MRKLLFLCTLGLLLSCSSDDQTITEIDLRVSIDHYKTTSLFHGTAFVATENGQSQEFEIPSILSFDFKPGFRYQTTVKRTTTKNDATNATTDSYALISVESQDTIPPNTRFTVPLAKFVNGFGYVTWIKGSANAGYLLSNEISVDCASFCSELTGSLLIQENITGEFEHGSGGSYRLVALY